MKNVIVFGAGGRTGRFIVKFALEAGHQVTAFDHQHPVGIENPALKIIADDVYKKDKVLDAIKGNDIIISALGVRQIEGDAVNLMSDAMKIFVEAAGTFGINRVLAIGGLAVLQWNDTMQLIEKPDYPPLYKNVGEGHNKVYKVLRQTNLDWTFVCCPDIIDGERTGKYIVKKDYPAGGLSKIFTADLADFIVKEMVENKFLKTRVGISNVE